MWQQNYAPVAGSLPLSALAAAMPIVVLLLLLAVARKPAWVASLAGLGAAAVLAGAVYGMPLGPLFASIAYGAAFGLFPIGWVVFTAILLYRVTVESGKFEILKDSIANLTTDQRLQALLIAFAFGAFIEGAAGFGTPVAVAGAMLAGLGFTPFYAAAICLLANTAPVAFGSIAIPITTLAVTTGLPVDRLSAGVGRICAPVSLFVPAYLILVMSGWSGLRAVLPGRGRVRHRLRRHAVCRIEFRRTATHRYPRLDGRHGFAGRCSSASGARRPRRTALRRARARNRCSPGRLTSCWWSSCCCGAKLQPQLNTTNIVIPWPMLHNAIQRMPPAVAKPRALRRRVYVRLALGLGDGVPDRGDSRRHRCRPEAAAVRARRRTDCAPVGQSRTHARRRARRWRS